MTYKLPEKHQIYNEMSDSVNCNNETSYTSVYWSHNIFCCVFFLCLFFFFIYRSFAILRNQAVFYFLCLKIYFQPNPHRFVIFGTKTLHKMDSIPLACCFAGSHPLILLFCWVTCSSVMSSKYATTSNVREAYHFVDMEMCSDQFNSGWSNSYGEISKTVETVKHGFFLTTEGI